MNVCPEEDLLQFMPFALPPYDNFAINGATVNRCYIVRVKIRRGKKGSSCLVLPMREVFIICLIHEVCNLSVYTIMAHYGLMNENQKTFPLVGSRGDDFAVLGGPLRCRFSYFCNKKIHPSYC